MRYKKILFLCLLISMALFLSCCTSKKNTKETPAPHTDKDFSRLTDKMFREYLVGNTINMHTMILHPENFGIDEYKVTLGDFSPDSFKNTDSDICKSLHNLSRINFDNLSDSQKLTYNIIKTKLADSLEYCDYYMLDEYLSPSDGQQQLLPVYLAEYTFTSVKDIEDYLEILRLSESFFSSLLDFEKLKAESGTFMNEFQADKVIHQCLEFTDNAEEHYLITTFNERISNMDELSEQQKESYRNLNCEYLNKYYFPSYKNIASTMQELKKSSKNLGGLCNYENGSIYYEGLVRTKTGSPKSVKEIQQMLENAMASDTIRLHEIYTANPDIEKRLRQYSSEYCDIDKIIQNLHKNTSMAFPAPAVNNDDVQIHSVPDTMEKYEAPAYYLSPPIDCLTQNSIYINNSCYEDKPISELIPVLAHEGFPGHLYQTTYFRSTNPDNLRLIQHFPGYSEGWGTYAELYSYYMTGLDDTAAEYNVCYTSLTLELYSLIDIYVNYNGWSLNRLMEYCSSWGLDQNAAIQIYQAVIESPSNYLQYSVGYLEIQNLREEAQNRLGDKFSIKDFHKFILDVGPAQFEIIAGQMENWISGFPSAGKKLSK